MKKIFCFLFLYKIAILAAIAQQDPQFSFNRMTQLTVNPGYAGNDGFINGLILNRYQWVGIEGAPKTLVFSIEAASNLFGLSSGIGMNVISDELGFQMNISVSFDYAYRKKTGIGDIGIGTSVGFYNMAVNGVGRWHFPEGELWNSSDTGFPQGEASQLAFDIGFGVFIKSKDYFFGTSVTHLNQASIILEDEARTFLARHYYLAAGYNISLSDPLFELQPSVYFKTDMAAYQTDVTVDLVYKKRFKAGLNYRINDAICILLGFEMNNGLKIGYAYDLTTSALSGYSGGSHELYLSYSFDLGKNRNKKYKSVRYL
ncbi:MAG TPA: type IX secretion system membrane protein PorP/SprF [Prolixibacteraceae bacterium]|nr:type IX secretion system membrane protein PorP/SprF [Prolixibacteraceae bacterium]